MIFLRVFRLKQMRGGCRRNKQAAKLLREDALTLLLMVKRKNCAKSVASLQIVARVAPGGLNGVVDDFGWAGMVIFAGFKSNMLKNAGRISMSCFFSGFVECGAQLIIATKLLVHPGRVFCWFDAT